MNSNNHRFIYVLFCILLSISGLQAQTRLCSLGAMRVLYDGYSAGCISSVLDTSSLYLPSAAFCDPAHSDGFYLDTDSKAIIYTNYSSPRKQSLEKRTIKADSILCYALKNFIELAVRTSSPVAENDDIIDGMEVYLISGNDIACNRGYSRIQKELYDVMRSICTACNDGISPSRVELLPRISRLEAEYKKLVNLDYWRFEDNGHFGGWAYFGLGYKNYRIYVDVAPDLAIKFTDDNHNKEILLPLAEYLIANCSGPAICSISITTDAKTRCQKDIQDIVISPKYFQKDSLISICRQILSSSR